MRATQTPTARTRPPAILTMFPVCHFRRERRVTIITMHRGERQLMLTRMPHTCGAPWPAPKDSKPCTKRAARHTIVLISLRRGQHHGDCRGAVTHYMCVCSALQMQSSILERQRSVWADRRSASEHRQPSCRQCECFRLHDCIVGRSPPCTSATPVQHGS